MTRRALPVLVSPKELTSPQFPLDWPKLSQSSQILGPDWFQLEGVFADLYLQVRIKKVLMDITDHLKKR